MNRRSFLKSAGWCLGSLFILPKIELLEAKGIKDDIRSIADVSPEHSKSTKTEPINEVSFLRYRSLIDREIRYIPAKMSRIGEYHRIEFNDMAYYIIDSVWKREYMSRGSLMRGKGLYLMYMSSYVHRVSTGETLKNRWTTKEQAIKEIDHASIG
jgi:hypothetical protein